MYILETLDVFTETKLPTQTSTLQVSLQIK